MIRTGLVYFSIIFVTLMLFQAYKVRFRFGKIVIHEENKLDLISTLFISFPIVLIMSIRYGIGTDYFNYVRIYNNFIAGGKSSLEIGYQFLMNLSNWIFHDFQGVMFLTSLLTVVPIIVWVLKMKPDSRIWGLIVVFCLYFSMWQNTIRQAIAISIFIWATKQIENRCLWKFLLLIILASCFHTSCLFMIPCYFFVDSRVQRQSGVGYTARYIFKVVGLLFIIILAAFVFFEFGQTIGWEYSSYIGSNAGGTTIYFLLFAIILVVPELFFMKKMVAKGKQYELYYLFVIAEVIVLIFGLYVSYGFRIAQYFSFAHAFLIPEIGATFKSKTSRLLWNIIFMAILFFRFMLLNLSWGYDGIVPYQTIF